MNIAIIPARGGSKRIPRKNILPLNGIPLLAYAIRAAQSSGCFDEVLVSTEDMEIKDLAEREGALVDNRPASMAGDLVTKVQVVKEYLSRPENENKYETVCALLPTCPFRSAKDIQNAFDVFSRGSTKFLVGVTAYDFPIQLALTSDSNERGLMKPFFEGGYKKTRSQDIQTMYHPNGAMYIAGVKEFLALGTFFNDQMLTYEMPAINSFDIDYPWQFEVAEVIAQKKLYLTNDK